MTKPGVLFIGLDAAEPELLKRWALDGDLPAIAQLMGSAATVDIELPDGFSDGCAWPTLLTGVNPGRHGRYSSAIWRRGTYDYAGSFDEDRDFATAPFWTKLRDTGARVGIVDMVRAPLTPGIDGYQIADWLTHDRRRETRSYPEHITQTIFREYGRDRVGGMSEHFLEHHSTADLVAVWQAQIELKTRQAIDSARSQPTDLLMTAFGECHDVGHTLWHLHDETHPDFDAAGQASLGDVVKIIYQALDAAIARILDRVEPDYLLLFAGAGMGPNYTANSAMATMLADLEKRLYPSPPLSSAANRPALRTILRSAVPPPARRLLRALAPQRLTDRWDKPDMSPRRFFHMPHTGYSGAIRINLRGREAAGRIEPGREYRELCEELATCLMQAVNADTGEPVVSRVVRVHDTCRGPGLDLLPDLLVVWNRAGPIRRVSLPSVGEYEVVQPGRRGDHTDNAVLFARGPGFGAGRTAGAKVEDIAPTIVKLLGHEPMGFDGVPIETV